MSPSGACLCGAVTFTATPKSTDVGACHCATCRKQAAGPFFAVDCGDTLEFVNTDALGVYESSEWANRTFCKKCGTVLAWRMKDGSINIVNVEAFEDLKDLSLDHEVYIDKKPAYYSFAQDTKKLTEADIMKMFADGQEH